jgi:RNA polymerase sigma-70 factor, ECF subfamily
LREPELIDAALRGDPGAERALYDAHVDRVFRLAYRICGDETMAEDLTQDTFIRAFRYLPGFRGQSALATWLHSIAMSVILNGLRKVRPMDRWTEIDEERAPRGAPKPDRELRLTLARSVDELPENLRTVFLMHDVEGYKHAEIAGALAIPVGTSKARLSRAREKLRRALGEPGRRAAAKESSR